VDSNLDQLPNRMKNLETDSDRDFSAVFGPRFRRFFIHLGSPPADAEDLAITCVTDVWLKIDRFVDRGPGSFEAWAFRVARNTWIDERRRERGMQAIADDFPDKDEPKFPTGPAPEMTEAVIAALDGLSEMDRTIIRLKYLEGELSFADIGRELGLTEVAARVRHHRAIQTLRSRLSGYAPAGAPTPRCGTTIGAEEGEVCQ
jgi:RNA polymerase sigma factor (sigma-70 family)